MSKNVQNVLPTYWTWFLNSLNQIIFYLLKPLEKNAHGYIFFFIANTLHLINLDQFSKPFIQFSKQIHIWKGDAFIQSDLQLGNT